ncbi:hypothetical protein GEV33_009972 [Tenebrio molitor]|uniref:Uncharacterized protein n=1 Tax=Tenebrio molitor TaxID=7067 RepID=A0A8J6HDM0_TENMO|nr:hypothetical protein GEV33_009972 [Tenebrio molitor]
MRNRTLPNHPKAYRHQYRPARGPIRHQEVTTSSPTKTRTREVLQLSTHEDTDTNRIVTTYYFNTNDII